MISSFFTLNSPGEAIYKEKGSKFLAFAYPVLTEEDINVQIENLRKKYHDARHHCYAFVLGTKGDNFRVNDDGEPGHSAGDPIMAAIRSHNLTNVLIVVVRYFGGIKLGVGGLIQAYRTSADMALNATRIIEKEILQKFKIQFTYPNTSEVMALFSKQGAKIIEQDFQETCKVVLEINVNSAEELKEKLNQFLTQKIIISFDVTS